MAKVLTIVSTGAMKGVKGAAETAYRDGYVNITPENIGFIIVEIDQDSGTLSADELKVLKDNPFNCMGYAPANEGIYIFKLIMKASENWTYASVKEDQTGTLIIEVNMTTGAYSYSYVQSEVGEEVEEVTEAVNTLEETVSDLEQTVNSLKVNGGDIE